MTWKQFKTWLDKNIIESKELKVKIRLEKQDRYGELSTITLTNFCDSLEATLDNNTSYHLFPIFDDDKEFGELFDYDNCHFGKKTSQEKVNKSDYDLLAKLFEDWKEINANLANWKSIHADFTEELVENWQKSGFTLEQTEEWIKAGFEPKDIEIVNFVWNRLGYDAKTVLDNSDVETLKSIYKESLKSQEAMADQQLQEALAASLFFSSNSQTNEDLQDLQIREALAQSLAEITTQENLFNYQLNEEESDMGWLTDDNIAYILQNDEEIKKTDDIQVKNDIANIYFQIEKTKKGEKVDEFFWKSLDTKKKYVILPLRVSGNHWSLLLIVNNEYNGKVQWVYYISSLNLSAADKEVKEINSFLRQVGKRFNQDNNKVINENNLSEAIFQENPRQPNTWDCGVYLCLFVKFLCHNHYYNLNEANCWVSSQHIKEFRDKWKKEIGEGKWCKWDAVNENALNNEESQLQKALAQSLLFDTKNNEPHERENLERKLGEEKSKNKELEIKIGSLESQLFLKIIDNESLEKEKKVLEKKLVRANISADNSLKESLKLVHQKNEELVKEKSQLEEILKNLTLTNKNLHKELAKEKKEKQFFSEQLQIIKQQNLQIEITTKHNQLANLIMQLKNRPNVNNFHYAIDNLLEIYSELVKSNSSFAQKLFVKNKQELLNSQQITEQEIDIICQSQAELTRLETQREQLEARIEINPYSNN